MNKSDYNKQLDASYELDAQVALRLGWTYQEATKQRLPVWISPIGKQYARPPRFSYDLNFAVELWTEDIRWGLFLDDDCLAVYYASYPGQGSDRGYVIAQRPAVAICHAFCEWADKRTKTLAKEIIDAN